MIISGGSRTNGKWFNTHLSSTLQNDRVEVIEIRGLASENMRDAFHEMQILASVNRKIKNWFYHANINTREDEHLTPEQWALAADTLEAELGLTGQPRFIVEHEKNGRTHQHIIWGRVDADTSRAIPDGWNYLQHERAAAKLEIDFAHEHTPRGLTRDAATDPTPRDTQRPKDYEAFRSQRSKIDGKVVSQEITGLWNSADSGVAFAAAVEDRGYILTRGDKRSYVLIDHHGDDHSLARRIKGVKAADVMARMIDVDLATLPNVAEGRDLARQRWEASGDTAEAPAPVDAAADAAPPDAVETLPESAISDASTKRTIDKVHAAFTRRLTHQDPADLVPDDKPKVDRTSGVETVHNRAIAEAKADQKALQVEEANQPGARFERVRAWWGNMQTRFHDWRGIIQQQFDHLRGREAVQETPPAPATPSPMPQTPPEKDEPQL